MTRSSRRRALTLAAAILATIRVPGAARAQDPPPAPGDTLAVPDSAAVNDSLGPPAPLEPIADPLLAGLDSEPSGSAFPWLVELSGWRGFGIEHYNRVDGLTPSWGLRLTPVEPETRPEIAARIAAATTHAQLYWTGSIRQRIPAPGAIHAEFEIFHRSATFDDWKISTRENDVATFVSASDMLDWWREKGWTAGLDAETSDGRLGGSLAFTDASHRSLRDRSPFALLGRNYRDNPPADEGDFRGLWATLRVDTRDVQSPLLPSPGWWVRLDAEIGGGVLGGDIDFRRAAVDLRRFTRVASDSWWNSRVVWMGPLDGDSLPAQRHFMLGGPGSLRGFRGGSFVDSQGVQASTEVRLPLPVGRRIALLFLSWHWVAFADAGALGDYEDWHADVGTGISGLTLLSQVELFVAQRVTDLDEDGSGPRFVVRFRRDL
jgi:hypothetical protein